MVSSRLCLVAALFAMSITFSACQNAGPDLPLVYPDAPRGDQTDDYFGTPVSDPYRWMEDLAAPEVEEWVKAQNEIAARFLESLAGHGDLQNRLTELWNYERFGVPFREGGLYFFTRNDGLQDQDVLLVAEALEAEPRVLIDPNGFSEDATIALAGWSVSPDGQYIAYSTSDGGTDWNTWHVREVATGEDLGDEVGFTKFTGASWLPNGSGFFYSRHPVGPDGVGDGQAQVKVYFHPVGAAQEEDELVYAVEDSETRNPFGTVTEDGRYLILNLFEGYNENAIYYRDLGAPSGQVVRLLDAWDALYTFIGNDGPVFFFHTNKDAPRNRVVAIDIQRPDPTEWEEVIPEAGETLESASYVGGAFVVQYLRDANSLVRLFSRSGEVIRDVPLPGIGTVGGFGGHADNPETFFAFQSYTVPPTLYRYDVGTGETAVYRETRVDVDPSKYETVQVFYTSADGTRVPMFLTYKAGMEKTGQNPTLLYGYGGFNISETPSFRVDRMVWLEMGGVFAHANLRGGGEYGEEWHQAGTKTNKQNVFDDFIAAAEYLISEGYTSTPRLAIQGGSNGGLLVGAVMTQRPELFGAALPAVGVLDMLRYHTASLNARQWSSDYGLSENEVEFGALYAYSPYHNVREGSCYPPTLVTTADRDDRVVPWNSFKFGAALQHAQACENPILIRVETRAGHGAGKPTWMRIEEAADAWAFLKWALGF
ncbi:MAG: prolyl oligopeptidase family serine peptidase [Gemmatimonadota bacterium]